MPWKTNNLLGSPPKVQQAKESLMEDIDGHIGECFDKSTCPAPILAFMKLVAKLKFDEKPNYENYRKEFQRGLQSLGKTDSGDLDFKATTSPAAAAKEQKKGRRGTDVPKAANKSQEDAENISPKPRTTASKKRSPRDNDDSVDNSQSPSKKSRASAKSTSRQIVPTQSTAGKSTDTSIVVNNLVNGSKSGKNKTYELNFELDISFDANVVVNVKRKPKKSPKAKKEAEKVSSRHDASTDEIPGTEKSFAIGTAKVLKRGVRTSPRAKK